MTRKKSKKTNDGDVSGMSFEQAEELRRVRKSLRQSRAFLSKAEDAGESGGVISGARQAVKKFTKEKEWIERKTRVKKRLKSLGEKALTGDLKVLKRKILTRPTAKGPTPISASKTLKSFAQNSGPLVREVEPRAVVHDDRSLFFKREFVGEQMGANKWLS